MAHREATGGLIPIVKISKGLKEDPEDIKTALSKLQKLGSGYQIVGKGDNCVVQGGASNISGHLTSKSHSASFLIFSLILNVMYYKIRTSRSSSLELKKKCLNVENPCH